MRRLNFLVLRMPSNASKANIFRCINLCDSERIFLFHSYFPDCRVEAFVMVFENELRFNEVPHSLNRCHSHHGPSIDPLIPFVIPPTYQEIECTYPSDGGEFESLINSINSINSIQQKRFVFFQVQNERT